MPSDTTILSGTYFNTVTLDVVTTTLAGTGLIQVTGSTAVYGAGGTAWTLANYGTIVGGGDAAGDYGVSLAAGGSVTNAHGGSIYGSDGIYVGGAPGTVVNAGDIAGAGTASQYGVTLAAGGYITNAAGGTITGYNGVGIAAGPGTLANTGNIVAYGTGGSAAILAGGGYITNAAGGTITGYYGVRISGGLGTLVNSGVIAGSGTYGAGVYLAAGGSVTNTSSGSITGYDGLGIKYAPGTVVNMGGITASGDHAEAVYLGAGGSITNAGTASIVATGTFGYGVVIVGDGSITNAGLITASGEYGTAILLVTGGGITNSSGGTIAATGTYGTAVSLVAGGTVINQGGGTIVSYSTYGVAVQLAKGGAVINQAGGSITGGIGVKAAYSATIVNYGTIQGTGTAVGGGPAAGVNLLVLSSVTNQSGGLITGYDGIYGALGPTVVNYGSIAGVGTYGAGLRLEVAGTVINQTDGTITGYDGIDSRFSMTIMNYGTIAGRGAAGYGVYIGVYSILTNQSGGTITGYDGVSGNVDATVVNAGLIAGYRTGITIAKGGTVTNQSGGTISGYYGHTTTSAAGYNAVTFSAGYTNLLVVDPRATFLGTVDGGNAPGASYVSTIELASAASIGTLTGIGTQYTDFAHITVDAGAQWQLSGANTILAGVTLTDLGTITGSGVLANYGVITTDPSEFIYNGTITGSGTIDIGAGSDVTFNGGVARQQTIAFTDSTGTLTLGDTTDFAATIDGLMNGDHIVLTGVTDAQTPGTIISGNTLEITRTGNPPIDLTLDPTQDFTGAVFKVTEQAGNAVIDLACFADGTRITTPLGMVAVEAMRAGDSVLTADGHIRIVRWIGFRHIDLTRYPEPERAEPLVIAPNAFADGVPSREVRLSPDHGVLLDGMLVPVKLLRNNASIRRHTGGRAVTYYHIELDSHDILLAEGLPAESYLDTGNRGMFENSATPLLHRSAFPAAMLRRENKEFLAPFVADPKHLEPLWRRLAARSEAIGLPVPQPAETTRDPGLLIVANGRTIAPIAHSALHYSFLLPAGSADVRLISRTAAHCDERPWIDDPRTLGVSVRRLTRRNAGSTDTIPLDHPTLTEGWWEPEGDTRVMWRWTRGDAILPGCSDTPVILDVELASTLLYTIETPVDGAIPINRAA